MAKITYENKVGITPKTVHINQVWDDDMNEIKDVINANDDRLTALETGDITPTIAYANWTGTGLTFDVVASSFPVQKTYYSAPNTQVTLSASDATLFRYDLIVAKKPTAPATEGIIQVIEGALASESLVIPPDYDPSEYYLIKTVLVKPAATEPSDPNTGNTFVSELVYANGTGEPNEWTFSSNSATIVNSGGLINATNPLSTSKATLTNDADVTGLDSSKNFSLEFEITLKGSIENSYIVIKLFDINGRQMTTSLLLNDGDLGFSASSLSTQKLVVDGSMFSFVSLGNVSRLDIYINRSFAGYTLDNIKFTLNGSVSDSGNMQYVGIEEAPKDGNDYVRNNGAWKVASTGGTFTDYEEIGYACSDETTDLTLGTLATFRMPFAMTLQSVRASLTEASTISSVVVNITQNGTSIFSTTLSIDANEKTSVTAATPAVLSTTALTDDAEIKVITTQIGSGDAGKGLKVIFKGYR